MLIGGKTVLRWDKLGRHGGGRLQLQRIYPPNTHYPAEDSKLFKGQRTKILGLSSHTDLQLLVLINA